jgi:hypothetical protein
MSKAILLFASLALFCCLSISTLPQEKPSAEDQAKLDKAQKEAERFVERFRRTLDFATVWREFHSSDIKCALYSTPVFSQFGHPIEEKQLEQLLKERKLNYKLLRRLHFSFWNYALLGGSYTYSLAPIDDDGDPDPENISKDPRYARQWRIIEKAFEKVGNIVDEIRKTPSVKTYEKFILGVNHIAALSKRYMPRNALRTKSWRSSVESFKKKLKPEIVREHVDDLCLAKEGRPVYIVSVGPFSFGFIEENGKMKLLTMLFLLGD